MKNHNILGQVKNCFYRYEFQGAGAKGNKPNVHCGIILYDENDIATVKRICGETLLFVCLFV